MSFILLNSPQSLFVFRRLVTSERKAAATIGSAAIGAGSLQTKKSALRPRLDTFYDELANHIDEGRMCPHRLRARHRYAQLVRQLPRLHIEIIEHLDMIGQKANRRNHDRLFALILQYAQGIADVRLQPGLRRRAAPALV